jgi:chromosomal replication initiation ATPase DnaA
MITQTEKDTLITILRLRKIQTGQDTNDLIDTVQKIPVKSLVQMRKDVGKARKVKVTSGLVYDRRLTDYIKEGRMEQVDPDRILEAVESVTGVPVAAILGKARHRPTVDARHMVCGLLYVYCPHFGMIELGRIVCRNYATVIHSIKMFDSLSDTDAGFADKRRKVEAILNGGKP